MVEPVRRAADDLLRAQQCDEPGLVLGSEARPGPSLPARLLQPAQELDDGALQADRGGSGHGSWSLGLVEVEEIGRRRRCWREQVRSSGCAVGRREQIGGRGGCIDRRKQVRSGSGRVATGRLQARGRAGRRRATATLGHAHELPKRQPRHRPRGRLLLQVLQQVSEHPLAPAGVLGMQLMGELGGVPRLEWRQVRRRQHRVLRRVVTDSAAAHGRVREELVRQRMPDEQAGAGGKQQRAASDPDERGAHGCRRHRDLTHQAPRRTLRRELSRRPLQVELHLVGETHG